MFFYYFIFVFIGFLLFVSPYFKIRQTFSLFIIAVLLILVAGLRHPGVDGDSETYIDVFNNFGSPANYFKEYNVVSFFEPAYYLIPSIIGITLGLNYVWVFLTFAIISISLKFVAITRLTHFALLSVLVYYSHFFILHDMTQIRTGVASAIILLSIPEIQKRNFVKFLLLITLGFLFHYSTIIFLPVFFLSSTKINKKFYLTLLFVPYILHFFKFNILSFLQLFKLGFISDKIQLYNDLLEADIFTDINIFNILFVVQLICCTVFILKSDLLFKKNKHALLLVKIYCIAAASFVLFSNVPVLAFRISELFGIVQIIVMPFILYIVKPKYVALAIIIVFAIVSISNDLIHVGFLKPYFAGVLNHRFDAA